MNDRGETAVILALGGNLPGPFGCLRTTLSEGLARLEKAGIRIVAQSAWYQTSPVPATGQPDFLNLSVRAMTALAPSDLLDRLHAIEAELGRQREERWSARTLDIDLLFYGDAVLPGIEAWHDIEAHHDPAYMPTVPVVPHPRAHKRAFVLVPLLDIDPDGVHPVLGLTARECLARLKPSGNDEIVKRIENSP